MKIIQRYDKVIIFFLITYCVTWVLWLPLIIFHPPIKFFHQIGGMGPLIGAFLAIILFEGTTKLKSLIKEIFRFELRWILVAFFTPFLLFLVASVISFFIHGTMPHFQLLLYSQEYPNIGILYWIISIICYGFGEQVGWRGYALPELIKSGLNPVYASTVLSIFWAIWHLPLFWYPNSGYFTMNSAMILGWFGSLILSSYLLTWLFNTSKKSIAAVAIFHGTIDIVMTSLAVQGDIVMIMSMFLMILGLLVLLSGKSLEGIPHVRK